MTGLIETTGGDTDGVRIDCMDLPIGLVQWEDATPRHEPSTTGAKLENILIGCRLAAYGVSAVAASFIPRVPRPARISAKIVGSVLIGAGALDVADEI